MSKLMREIVNWVAKALMAGALIVSPASADSTLTGLSPAQLQGLAGQLKAIYDEGQPDVVLFGENHCYTAPDEFLGAQEMIRLHADAGFHSAFYEEPVKVQPWFDHIAKAAVTPAASPEKQHKEDEFERQMARALFLSGKDATRQCPDASLQTRSEMTIDLVKNFARANITFVASDYTAEASDTAQDQERNDPSRANRQKFQAIRTDERTASEQIRAALPNGKVFVLRGSNHFLVSSDTAMRENLAGLKVITFVFDYTGHTVADEEKRIRREGFFPFNAPDYVIDVTSEHSGIYPWRPGGAYLR